MRALALVVLLTGCLGSDPHLVDVQCTPDPLSVGSPGPYEVTCVAKFEGKIDDISATAFNADFSRWSNTRHPVPGERDSGTESVVFREDDPPQLGLLTVAVTMNDLAGSDGPPSDDMETRIQVVP